MKLFKNSMFDREHLYRLIFITNRRAHDFGVLLKNLKEQKSKFDTDHHNLIDRFLNMVHPFRRDANSKVHKVIEYLESMREIKKLKITEMVQILLKLIERVKKQTQT